MFQYDDQPNVLGGDKMRNLDDLVMYLEDAAKVLTEFLKKPPKEDK